MGAATIVDEGGGPMQTLRAAAIALPFLGLAIVIGLLSVVIGRGP
jgi:hypothetical protein